MSEERRIPVFESEEAEAAWWFDQRERVAADFEKAAADGTLRRRRKPSEKSPASAVSMTAEHVIRSRKAV